MDLNRLLYFAVAKQDVGTVKFLLDHRAQPNANINTGLDPLQRYNSDLSQHMNQMLDSPTESAATSERGSTTHGSNTSINTAINEPSDERLQTSTKNERRSSFSSMFINSTIFRKNRRKYNTWNPSQIHEAARRFADRYNNNNTEENTIVEEIADEVIARNKTADLPLDVDRAVIAEEVNVSLKEAKISKIRDFFMKLFGKKSKRQMNSEDAALEAERMKNRQLIMKRMPTAMHQAAATGNVEIIRMLIKHGGNVNTELESTYAPLDIAVIFNHQGAAKLLLDFKANVNARRNTTGKTALYYAIKAGGESTMIYLLLKHGADPRTRTASGVTPLHLAVERRCHAAIELLMARGCNLNARTVTGITPLHYAAAKGDPVIFGILVHYGAKLSTIVKNRNIDISPLSFENDNDKEIITDALNNCSQKPGFYEMMVTKLLQQFRESETSVLSAIVKS